MQNTQILTKTIQASVSKLNIATDKITHAVLAQVRLDAIWSLINDFFLLIACITVIFAIAWVKKKFEPDWDDGFWLSLFQVLCSIVGIIVLCCIVNDIYWIITAYHNPIVYAIKFASSLTH